MTESGDAARAWATANGDQFVAQLEQLLRIPSLSGDPAHAGDVRACAQWLADHLTSIGMTTVEIMETAGHPAVYGEWLGAGPDSPTVLVYGHYDVVPASKSDGWNTEPFDPVVKDGKIWARGATDDKGQFFIHVKAFEAFMQAGAKARGQSQVFA